MESIRTLERQSQGLGQRPALVVVDIVKGFTDPSCPLGSEADEVVAANVTLMNAFHERSLPVFLTTVIYRNDQQARVFRDRVPALNLLKPDAEWVQFDHRLPQQASDIVLEIGQATHEALRRNGVQREQQQAHQQQQSQQP